jgi:6,7-dimethyl-8-ribityllumazine synthase
MNQTSQLDPVPLPSATAAGLRPLKVAVIAASWHQKIVSASTNAIQLEFDRQGCPPDCLELHQVPGAFEIPLFAMRLARTGRYDAIIACGLVVNGGIYRHEFVASAVIDGLMRVQLDTDIPTFSAVLTPRDFHEHEEHQAFFKAHFVKKGVEVAQACLNTLDALADLSEPA